MQDVRKGEILYFGPTAFRRVKYVRWGLIILPANLQASLRISIDIYPGVYAPNNREEREEEWWELAAVRCLFNGPWVVTGDFNVVRYPSEKQNCIRFTKVMEEITEFIRTWN